MKALERAIDYLIEHQWARIAWYVGISVLATILVLIGDARAAEFPPELQGMWHETDGETLPVAPDKCPERTILKHRAIYVDPDSIVTTPQGLRCYLTNLKSKPSHGGTIYTSELRCDDTVRTLTFDAGENIMSVNDGDTRLGLYARECYN